jgi:hypothetical protein
LVSKVRGEGVDAVLASGDQRDVETLIAELSGDGGAEASAGANDCDRCH